MQAPISTVESSGVSWEGIGLHCRTITKLFGVTQSFGGPTLTADFFSTFLTSPQKRLMTTTTPFPLVTIYLIQKNLVCYISNVVKLSQQLENRTRGIRI